MTLENLIKQIKINSRLKFKNDNNTYYNKNLSVDKKNIFVTLNGLQTYRKLLKNLIQVDNNKLDEMKNLKETIKKVLKEATKSIKQEFLVKVTSEEGITSEDIESSIWDKMGPDYIKKIDVSYSKNLKETWSKSDKRILKTISKGHKRAEDIIDAAIESWKEFKEKSAKSEDKEHADKWIEFFENEKKKYQIKEANVIDEEGWFISGWFDIEGLVWGEKDGKEQWISPSGEGTYLIYANKQDALLKASEAATIPAKFGKQERWAGGKIYDVDEPGDDESPEEDILVQKYEGPYDNPPEKTKWVGLKGANVTAKPKMPVKWDLTNTKTGERSKGQGLYEKVMKKIKESKESKESKSCSCGCGGSCKH